MFAINTFSNAKKGMSAMQLQREIGVTYKTAWRMLQQIRIAMSNEDQSQYIGAKVEIDETYVGGKPRKPNFHPPKQEDEVKDTSHYGRGTKKTPVVGVLDRDHKKVYAKSFA